MNHTTRLSAALCRLLNQQRVAALGTLDVGGFPFVSMVPFARDAASGTLVIHVSTLAAHARNLQAVPQVSLLVMQAAAEGAPVHDLPRVTLAGLATFAPAESTEWVNARAAYLARFPDVEYMTHFGDFRFVTIAVQSARQVAGFGAARSLEAGELQQLLQRPL